ncbi:MAG: hypothetical protein JXA78_02825 [Anaerolineales bacterium]|nr:hypothetical protein [Anaerolineales bacterium]
MNEMEHEEFTEKHFLKGPLLPLEKKLIEEYLAERGYSLKNLHQLPEEKAKQLLKEACSYASLKLAEVEAKSQFREKIHY